MSKREYEVHVTVVLKLTVEADSEEQAQHRFDGALQRDLSYKLAKYDDQVIDRFALKLNPDRTAQMTRTYVTLKRRSRYMCEICAEKPGELVLTKETP